MSKTTGKATIITTLTLASALLFECSSDSSGGSAPSPTGAVKIANPASTHCVSKGGKVVIQKDNDGNEIGICHLPDGSKVEEWELFRRDHPQSEK